jgi:hypothetical protein
MLKLKMSEINMLPSFKNFIKNALILRRKYELNCDRLKLFNKHIRKKHLIRLRWN